MTAHQHSRVTFKSEIDVERIQGMGGDHMVVSAARVSTYGAALFSKGDVPTSEKQGLINYLMKHRHGTPFEHSSMTFFVRAPIFVWREWHRHRVGFSYNEESGRYKKLEPVFYLPERDRPMMKIDGWKPGRPKFNLCTDDYRYKRICDNLRESYELSYDRYEQNLAMGIDPGIARACLPVGIFSSCWVTCNPRSLMHFLGLRVHEESATFTSYPLYEIEAAARACEKIFSGGWPLTHKAFVDNGRVAP